MYLQGRDKQKDWDHCEAINPHVTTFLQRLTEFEWRTSNQIIHGPCFLDIYTRRTTMKTSSLAILQDTVSVQQFFLSVTVLIFFPSFTRLLKIISATYTLIVTCIGSPYKSMNSVHRARSGFSAGQSSSFTPHTLIHVLVDPVLCIDLVV